MQQTQQSFGVNKTRRRVISYIRTNQSDMLPHTIPTVFNWPTYLENPNAGLGQATQFQEWILKNGKENPAKKINQLGWLAKKWRGRAK